MVAGVVASASRFGQLPYLGDGGYVTTPDSPDWVISSDVVITARTIVAPGSSGNVLRFLVGQYGSGTQAWLIYRADSSGFPLYFPLRDGVAGAERGGVVLTGAEVNAMGAGPVFIGVKVTNVNTANNVRSAAITSPDGVTWNEIGTPVATATMVSSRDIALPLAIGCRSSPLDRFWNQPIWWVEMRTGSVPGAGTLIFRFDPAEHPGGAVTTWSDPRGRSWTINDPAKIVRP